MSRTFDSGIWTAQHIMTTPGPWARSWDRHECLDDGPGRQHHPAHVPGPFVSASHVKMRANAIQRLTDALKSEHSHANLAYPRE